MAKKVFRNERGDIHLGVNAPEGFMPARLADVSKILSSLGKRKIWRCTVCDDLHIGVIPPKECPTCYAVDAYIEIEEKELKTRMGIK